MEDVKTPLLLAIATVTLLAIPTVSSEIEIQNQDALILETDSEFDDTFSVEIAEAETRTVLENKDFKIERYESPNEKIEKLSNSEGTLTIYENDSETFEKIETPYGELRSGYKEGSEFVDFEGADRERVENIKEDFQQRKDEADNLVDTKYENLVSSERQGLEITVDKEGNTYFEITNNAEQEINLKNWRIESDRSLDVNARDGYNYIDKEKTLSSGGELIIYTEDDNPEELEQNSIVADEITIYSSREDEIRLLDEWGNLRAVKTYNQ